MIGYVTIGTNDLPRATAFYDTLLAEIGAQRGWASDEGVSWNTRRGATLAVMKPFNGQPATPGNGNMAAISVKSKEDVDRVYAKAITLGGTDEGPAGARSDSFYAGYFRDLDGNKLCVFHMAS
jgi:catechol 2,3-dioxygenase-like lactoylglutathione lyase family enzyme